MCGIVGILGSPNPALLEKMRDAMVHRGPDDAGIHLVGEVGLAARRLSIVDIAHGHQPISNEDETIWVVQNGEIYNAPELRAELSQKGHQFKTLCDTEILVHAYESWGADFVSKLRGMFALAIWDQKKRKLLLARDRIGIKPLYVWRNQKNLVFASELRALLCHPNVGRGISPEAIHHYLTLQGVPPPLTIFQEIEAISPGEFRIYRPKEGEVSEDHRSSYWKPCSFLSQPKSSFRSIDAAAEDLEGKLTEAIRCHLLGDVPVGLFLSGGVDSSLLGALVRKSHSGDLRTLTVGWEDAPQGEGDERAVAEKVARALDAQHEEVLLSENNLRDELPRFIRALDQPSFDGLNSYLVSKAASRQVKVALSGLGGDELFLGYSYVPVLARLGKMEAWTRFLPNALARNAICMSAKLLNRPDGERAARLLFESEAWKLAHVGFSVFAPEQKRELEIPDQFQSARPTEEWVNDRLCGELLLDRLMSYGLRVYLPSPLLRDVDVMSMAHSLEVRVPYLDHQIIESACRLPSHFLYEGGQGKIVLRHLAQRLLPSEVLGPKRGFTLPMDRWLRGQLRWFVEDTLSEKRIRDRGLFHPSVVNRLKQEFFAEKDSYGKVWSLAVLESWLSSLDSN